MSETVGERIKDARVRLGRLRKERLTQDWLAAQVHVSKGTVAKWETDAQAPSGPALLALARVLEVSPQYILTGEEEETAEDAVYSPREAADDRRPVGEEELVEMPRVVRFLRSFDTRPDAQMLRLAAVRAWGEVFALAGGYPDWFVALRERVERGDF